MMIDQLGQRIAPNSRIHHAIHGTEAVLCFDLLREHSTRQHDAAGNSVEAEDICNHAAIGPCMYEMAIGPDLCLVSAHDGALLHTVNPVTLAKERE